ncbi:glycosyltransferase family 4 protein [Chloroflexota bacterium]
MALRIGIMARGDSAAVGGVNRYIANIIPALLSIDQRNEYVVYYDHPSHLGENPAAIEKVIKLPSKMLYDHVALPMQTRRDKIDVLFCTKNVVPPLVSCKSVVTVHDLGYMVDKKHYHPLDTLYMNLAIRWSMRKGSAIIAISQNTKKDLISLLGTKEEKIHCVYFGINSEYRPIENREYLEGVRDKYDLPSEFILAISSLQRRKNLPNLVKAFSLVKERPNVNHKLVIIGVPLWQNSSVFDEINTSPVKDEIMWLKYVPEEDLPAIYNLASALAFPSLYEGFGFPLLESMACGCPVICSNTSSLPEIAGDAAVLIDPMSVEQLADGIISILSDDSLREDLTNKGLERASNFTWEKTAKETLNVFEAVYTNKSKA